MPWLDAPDDAFPDVSQALREPNGLLAVGGDLSPARLLEAYSKGIFPWYEEGQPILWWSPDPRMVLYPEDLHLSRSLRKALRTSPYRITFDQAFSQVVRCCAQPRLDAAGTWITDEMLDAYTDLNERGYAHSVEVWQDERLIGGLYGVALGRAFFGESMFSFEDNTSKIALAHLVEQLRCWNYELIDCQVTSEHLESLGAVEVSRDQFQQQLQQALGVAGKAPPWELSVNPSH